MESLPLWLASTAASSLLLVGISLLEILWRWHKVVAEASAALLVVGLPFLFMADLQPPAVALLAVLNIWLLFVAARLIFGRLDQPFLRASTTLNALAVLAAIVAVLLWVHFVWLSSQHYIAAFLIASLVIGWVFAWQAGWSHLHYRLRTSSQKQLKDLPTVSLCIPARNETAALRDCLLAAVASTYPKLEVLVLDDCSQDATSEVVRSFAKTGVRFVKGHSPASGWLGRNQAMSTLAHHATGEYLLFTDVDTLLGPGSIEAVVGYAMGRASMVSVLPFSRAGITAGAMFAPLRYYWQLALPVWNRHVPVSSRFWLIKASALRALGSFESVKHKIVPEESFARRLFAKNEYRFVVSEPTLGITTAKLWQDQARSALRLLYPTLKRQPAYALAATAALMALFILPFAAALYMAATGGFDLLFWLAVAASGLLVFSFALAESRLRPKTWPLASLVLPLLFAQELALLLVSMLAYEFSEVNWKGRNVCYPVISRGQRSVPAASELGQKSHDQQVQAG